VRNNLNLAEVAPLPRACTVGDASLLYRFGIDVGVRLTSPSFQRRATARRMIDPENGVTMGVNVKGMVQVDGTTYRIVRIKRGQYKVVRVLDDLSVGTFSVGTTFEIAPDGIDDDLMREIARVAIQGAKTTWVGRIV
jgi:hypothetical protein